MEGQSRGCTNKKLTASQMKLGKGERTEMTQLVMDEEKLRKFEMKL